MNRQSALHYNNSLISYCCCCCRVVSVGSIFNTCMGTCAHIAFKYYLYCWKYIQCVYNNYSGLTHKHIHSHIYPQTNTCMRKFKHSQWNTNFGVKCQLVKGLEVIIEAKGLSFVSKHYSNRTPANIFKSGCLLYIGTCLYICINREYFTKAYHIPVLSLNLTSVKKSFMRKKPIIVNFNGIILGVDRLPTRFETFFFIYF